MEDLKQEEKDVELSKGVISAATSTVGKSESDVEEIVKQFKVSFSLLSFADFDFSNSILRLLHPLAGGRPR